VVGCTEWSKVEHSKHQIENIYIYIDNRIQMHFDFHISPSLKFEKIPGAQEGSDRRVCNSW
jgi:hypothetical protein